MSLPYDPAVLAGAANSPAAGSGSPWPGAGAGFAALFLGLGLARFGYSPLVPVLVREHWFVPSSADYLGAVNLVGYVVGAWLSSRYLHHRPPGGWIRLAMASAAASFVACAWPLGFTWFFVWRLLAGIAAGVLMVLAVPTILGRTPAQRRGLVGGIIFTGAGAGIVVAGAGIPRLIPLGLTPTWLILGAAGALLTALVWPYWSLPVEPQPPPPPADTAPVRIGWPLGLLMAAYCSNAIGYAPHSLFWVDYIARELGRGLDAAGGYFVALGAAAALGPILAGLLGDRFGIRRCLAWGLLAEAGALALPVWNNTPPALLLSSVLVGGAAMGVTTLASARVIEMTPVAAQKRVWAWMTMAFAISYASAGSAFSFLYSRAGTYHDVFATAAAVLLAGGLLALRA